MVVHYVPASWEDAEGRFLGPVKLLERARALLPELAALPTFAWEWKRWVDAMEASGRLAPVLRWLVPDAALLWLWARHDDRPADMEALEAGAAPGLGSLATWDAERRAWARDPDRARSAHPLDDPARSWSMLVQRPAEVAWTPETYAPLAVRPLWSGHHHQDANRCVPLFRGWQALLLVEHVLAEPRHFPPPVPDGEQGGLVEPLRWHVAGKATGFVQHRAALEALSWFVSYWHHALQHARGERPDPGMFAPPGSAVAGGRFVVRGESLQFLIMEEGRVARQALDLHQLDEPRLLAAATWLGRCARDRRRTGHTAAAAAYANLMRDAIELATSLGHTRDEVTARMVDGEALRRELFPDFEEHAREGLRRQLTILAGEFRSRPDPRFVEFDDGVLDEFVGWLETHGLLAAHMAVPALMGYGHRPDRTADVGVSLQLSALSAWTEHVTGALTASHKPPPSVLTDKLLGCWLGRPAETDFRREWDARRVSSRLSLSDAVAGLLSKPVANLVAWMARDALVAREIRNKTLHQGLRGCTRGEMHDAACVLLRTAMGAWLVAR